MSPLYYTILWFFYLLAVVLAFAGAWRVSRSWPYPLKTLGRIALAVIFLTPAPQIAGGSGLAPAFVSVIFDQLQGIEEGWFRAGLYLVISGACAFLLYIALLVRWVFLKRKKAEKTD